MLVIVAIGLAAAWYTGQVEGFLISRSVRATAQENLEAQLATPAGYPGRRPVEMAPFAAELDGFDKARARELDGFLEWATLLDIQARFEAGSLSSSELTSYFLRRIRRYDERLKSVSELDPDVLRAARELDAERAAGRVRGALHGIPVLLKDNIATGGALHTTGGAAALRELHTLRDAPLVANLRRAGALILGKAAMSEWANFTSTRLPNGFSAVGGQVRNPYGAFDVSGSSSGSAVAVAAGFVTVSVGSETWGSLVSPASQNAVVTIKPSHGLVSGEGVIPIIPSYDTAGPIARSVTDAAILLEALAEEGAHYRSALDEKGLAGLRLGVVALRAEVTEGDDPLLAAAVEAIDAAGAEVVVLPPGSLADVRTQVTDFRALADHSFVRGVDAFLAGTRSKVRTLADVIAFNNEDPATRVPFGQDLLVRSQESSMSEAEYRATQTRAQARAREKIDGMLEENDLDLLLAIGSAFYVPYCDAGYPALVVPAGQRASGEPVGVTFVGRANAEALLIRAAFAFEQATRARRAPKLEP
ncbi:MAG: amidase [Deltaproteobacteria bacterium]|nr:amidase [Deltaproteobacteria bacterium]